MTLMSILSVIIDIKLYVSNLKQKSYLIMHFILYGILNTILFIYLFELVSRSRFN